MASRPGGDPGALSPGVGGGVRRNRRRGGARTGRWRGSPPDVQPRRVGVRAERKRAQDRRLLAGSGQRGSWTPPPPPWSSGYAVAARRSGCAISGPTRAGATTWRWSSAGPSPAKARWPPWHGRGPRQVPPEARGHRLPLPTRNSERCGRCPCGSETPTPWSSSMTRRWSSTAPSSTPWGPGSPPTLPSVAGRMSSSPGSSPEGTASRSGSGSGGWVGPRPRERAPVRFRGRRGGARACHPGTLRVEMPGGTLTVGVSGSLDVSSGARYRRWRKGP
jgi:hypothetical protein